MASLFESDGFVVLRGVAPPDLVARCRGAAQATFDDYLNTLAKRNETLGLGQRGGYREIVQRHAGRYEFRLELQELRSVIEHSRAFDVAAKVLQGPPSVVSCTCVLAAQGCEQQAWHVDGPHLSTTHHEPCHCLNIFVPLVQVDANSGTEYVLWLSTMILEQVPPRLALLDAGPQAHDAPRQGPQDAPADEHACPRSWRLSPLRLPHAASRDSEQLRRAATCLRPHRRKTLLPRHCQLSPTLHLRRGGQLTTLNPPSDGGSLF